jgi:L-lactate dehydrogenase complex protein LldF
VKEGYTPTTKTIAMKGMASVLANPVIFYFAGRTARFIMQKAPGLVNNSLNPWYKQREMPDPPVESFREWYKKNSRESKEKNNEQ